jgi:hypothetical protein
MTTTGDSELTATLAFSDADCSTLITISTPDCATPICRLGNSKEILGSLTVRQLIERVVSPNSLLSVHVPMSQLEAETPTALAVNELLKAGCDIFLEGDPGGDRLVELDHPAAAITEAQVGAQGSSFLNISLEIRPTSDRLVSGEDRRQVEVPDVVEVVTSPPVLAAFPEPEVVEEERRQIPLPEVVEASTSQDVPAGEVAVPDDPIQPMSVEKLEEIFADQEDEPIAATPTMMLTTPLEAPAADEPEQPIAAKSEAAVGAQSESAAASESAREPKIVAIVAERPARQPRSTGGPDARKEYIRKSDWLRAQFLPEVQALDFSGLFVGNLGMGVREQQARRRVVLADPARITDVLLRGNSFRRTGDHAKALICYQELVDMDPGNADFRFLLGKTLLELGQHNQGIDALNRAKELGHEGARKELDTVKPVVQRQRRPLGFLRFWKQ